MSYYGFCAISIAVLANTHLRSVRADCYSRDGVLARDSAVYAGPELLSCGKGTNNCCLSGEKCGTNLLCYGPVNGGDRRGYSREYCSDPNWTNCSQISPDTRAHGLAITSCGKNIYCHSPLDTCCTTGPTYFIDPMTGELKNTSEADSDASPTFWSIDSAILLATSSAMDLQPTNSIPTTSSPAISAGTSTTLPSSELTPPPSTSLSPGASAGIGVGCGVAVIASGILAWLLIRRRKSKAQEMLDYSTNVLPEHQTSLVADDKFPQMSYVQPHGEHYARHELDEGRPRAELHTTVMSNAARSH
ncbi:hypothetical protein GGP41_009629 [Bipolaris sorokiniana]|uniref:Mid2 domain-containing protein n=1 Tax=Cochliobolus sativus TaxID=45130 RepID=A0A8H5Z937_COCSA|nr:hypothetical protein GGP41_009629 [Bipolaris sorokiniana]